ncbi:MAG: CPBP family intramembrane metalloprotease [Chloroflexi bacterium]|nr:CPBP family intramembrane metalloprotease [Chloroflexota bacterium]MCL5026150.1 CPBP family intramembrane metalloprotease [Chloroflexota bacterium]
MSNLTAAAPFAILLITIVLANLADGRRACGRSGIAFAVAGYALLIAFYLVLLALGAMVQLLGTAPQEVLPPPVRQALPALASTRLFALGLWAPSLLGIVLLLKPTRRAAARVIRIDLASTVHAVALSFTALVLANLLATLGLGLENLANQLANPGLLASDVMTIAVIWAQEIFWVVLALAGVGLFTRRNLSDALRRLGLEVPTLHQVGLGILLGVLLVPLVALMIGAATALGIPIDTGVEKLSERLFGPLARSLPGILTLGLAAGLGEETLLRGALQPRFGLVLTAALFALLHSTYGLTIVTVVVFVLGLVLGIVRQRNNTSTSMLTHATYNIVMAGLGLLARSFQP